MATLKPIKVVVRAKHIKAGRACQGQACPIALALKTTYLGKMPLAHVYSTHVAAITKAGMNVYATLPVTAVKFIKRFDNGKKPKPFAFTLKPVATFHFKGY